MVQGCVVGLELQGFVHGSDGVVEPAFADEDAAEVTEGPVVVGFES